MGVSECETEREGECNVCDSVCTGIQPIKPLKLRLGYAIYIPFLSNFQIVNNALIDNRLKLLPNTIRERQRVGRGMCNFPLSFETGCTCN